MTFGVSAMMYVFHKAFPVAASSADRLPREVQHSYFGSDDDISSHDAVGTYRRPSCKVNEPVNRTWGCSSTCIRHITLPLSASSA
jgi:hypothetical protein